MISSSAVPGDTASRRPIFLARSGPALVLIWRFPEIRGTFFGDPYNKDYNILGSILGAP